MVPREPASLPRGGSDPEPSSRSSGFSSSRDRRGPSGLLAMEGLCGLRSCPFESLQRRAFCSLCSRATRCSMVCGGRL